MPTGLTCLLLFSGSLKVDSSSLSGTWAACSSVSCNVDDSISNWQGPGSMWPTMILGSLEPLAKPVTLYSECYNHQHPKVWQEVHPQGHSQAGFGISRRGRWARIQTSDGVAQFCFSPGDSPLCRGPFLALGRARSSLAGVSPSRQEGESVYIFFFSLCCQPLGDEIGHKPTGTRAQFHTSRSSHRLVLLPGSFPPLR